MDFNKTMLTFVSPPKTYKGKEKLSVAFTATEELHKKVE